MVTLFTKHLRNIAETVSIVFAQSISSSAQQLFFMGGLRNVGIKETLKCLNSY